MSETSPQYTAFIGQHCVGSNSDLGVLARVIKEAQEAGDKNTVLIFDEDSKLVDLDLRGSIATVLKRLSTLSKTEDSAVSSQEKPGRGRPKLGVTAREVTLLPRHWEWLNQQPGGASVALRKLVEDARRAQQPRDRARRSQEAAHRFMTAMCGDLPGYEEALRAFYAGNKRRFSSLIGEWPEGVRDHTKHLVAQALTDEASAVEAEAKHSS